MSSEGESRSILNAFEAAIDSERCNGEAGPHAALQQYAQLDWRVRAALGLPTLDTPNADAFALARPVAYPFQRFLNACAEADVDSSALWIKAVAEAEEAMNADMDPAELQALAQPPTPSHSPAQELENELAEAARSHSPSVANFPDSAPDASTPECEPSAPVTADPSSSTQTDPSSSTHTEPSSSTQSSTFTSTSSTTTATSASTSQSTPPPFPSAPTSTSTITFTPIIDAARPHIRALLSAPNLDWTTLCTKDVRARLVARGFDAAWVRERRRELGTVIEEEFDAAHTRWQAAQAAANNSAASPSQSGPAASQAASGGSTALLSPSRLEASPSASSHAAQPHAHTDDKPDAVATQTTVADTAEPPPNKRRTVPPNLSSSKTHAEDKPEAVAQVGSTKDVDVAQIVSAADVPVALAVPAEDKAAVPVDPAEGADVAPDPSDVKSPPRKRAKKRKVVSLLKSELEPSSPISRSTRSSTRANSNALSLLSRVQQTEIAARSPPARETPQQAPHSPSSALATPPTSGTGIKLRIPSLAARQAKQPGASASKSPLPATSPKRKRSPTPDSDEDEFAASFMRKRKVSAAAL